jgi:hypothetical protein
MFPKKTPRRRLFSAGANGSFSPLTRCRRVGVHMHPEPQSNMPVYIFLGAMVMACVALLVSLATAIG